MAFPTSVPIATARKELKPRVVVASFGDGYEQRIVDGINAAPEVWSVSFVPSSKSAIATLDDYLISQIGLAFSWTNPNGDTINVVCDEWSVDHQTGGLQSLSTTFKQVFGS